VIGCSGAGKTTLALELGRLTGLPVIHLDQIYWRPGWQKTPDEEWRNTVHGLIDQDEWIMDGNFSGTLPERVAKADLVVFFDFPTYVCVRRVLARWIKYRGRTRPDLHPGCPEKIDIEFLKWIWQYNKRSRPRVIKLLEEAQHTKTVFLRNGNDVARFREEFMSDRAASVAIESIECRQESVK